MLPKAFQQATRLAEEIFQETRKSIINFFEVFSLNFIFKNYFALALILRRFLCSRRVRFFFHFQRILAVDFLNGHP